MYTCEKLCGVPNDGSQIGYLILIFLPPLPSPWLPFEKYKIDHYLTPKES